MKKQMAASSWVALAGAGLLRNPHQEDADSAAADAAAETVGDRRTWYMLRPM